MYEEQLLVFCFFPSYLSVTNVCPVCVYIYNICHLYFIYQRQMSIMIFYIFINDVYMFRNYFYVSYISQIHDL